MNQKTINKISKLFTLSPLRYQGKAKGGFLSDNYIVDNNSGKYFLKKYRKSANNRLDVISKTENFFANQNIPVIMPLKTKSNMTYFNVDESFYSLFPYISGKTFDHKKNKVMPTLAKAIASNLATMHKLSKKKFPKISNVQLSEWNPKVVFSNTSRKNFYHYSQKIINLIKNKPRKSNFDKTALSLLELKQSLANSVPKSFNKKYLGSKHIVHGDYHSQNLFFNTKGQVTHVFDFEKSDNRARSLEIIRSIFLICFKSNFNSSRFKLAKTYLKEYCCVYPIKKSELQAAVKFVYYKNILNLWIEKEHYLNKNHRPDPLLRGELKFLKYLSKNLNIFVRKLILS